MSRRTVERLLVFAGGLEIAVGASLTIWPTVVPSWIAYGIMVIGIGTLAAGAGGVVAVTKNIIEARFNRLLGRLLKANAGKSLHQDIEHQRR
ncbi:MAG: hypothetical protein K2P86_04305 [Xanthobacteraceae bacterium]|nr:hypothetical protein [Xanthobacteraceae bacterium]